MTCNVTRFYDPDKGRILFGDNDIKTINLQCLRKNMGVVPQVDCISFFQKTSLVTRIVVLCTDMALWLYGHLSCVIVF